MSTQNPSVSPIDGGQQFAIPRGGALLMFVLYVIGAIVGVAFVAMWLTGIAEMGLGLAGVGAILLCLYLLPESLGPAFVGDALIVGKDQFQYVRGGKRVMGNIPFANVDDIVINQMDGGRSLWIRLKEPAAESTFWIGGLDSMNVIESQCGYHMVVGQGLRTDAKSLMTIFQEKCASVR